MVSTSPGYSLTIRVGAPPTIGATADLAAAVIKAGGSLTALDVVESNREMIVVDVTCDANSAEHGERITDDIRAIPGFSVHKVSDRTFLLHLGGKIEVNPKVPLKHRDDLSRAYTPGVARVSLAIAKNPEDARRLTIKRNTVAVVTDGTAVLGLGDIGPAAALPVMEGKAALFKQFGGVDAWPVCLDTKDVDEIVMIVKAIAPVYGGINLEDISAPRCFEVERRLRDLLDIPVFHDDQHGTAIVVLAALTNAMKVVGKKPADVKVVISGVGAAGHAIIRLLSAQGYPDIIGCDRHGAVNPDNPNLDEFRRWIADNTNPRGVQGTLAQALPGRTCSSGCRRRTCSPATTSPPWPATRSSSRWPTRTRRLTRSPPLNTRRSSPPAARTTRTRSTTCWRSPASSAACSTRALIRSPTPA